MLTITYDQYSIFFNEIYDENSDDLLGVQFYNFAKLYKYKEKEDIEVCKKIFSACDNLARLLIEEHLS